MSVEADEEMQEERGAVPVSPGFECLGWYAVGTKAVPPDVDIHRVEMEFIESPLFLLLDPELRGPSTKKMLPIALFESELHVLNGSPKMIFVKTPFKIETEGIAIDHISKLKQVVSTTSS